MEKKTMNFDDLSAYTGLAKSYLYKLHAKRIIQGSKPFGKCVFFDKEQIDALLLSKKATTAKAIESEAANYVTFKNAAK